MSPTRSMVCRMRISRFSSNGLQTSIISKSSLRAPQSGHVQFIGTSSHLVPGGMQADVLTLASMGCHPLTIVTALTVQDTLGIEGVFPVDADLISDQARCVLEDMPIDAFKIGLFGSVENISAIAEIVADYPDIPLVLDPMLSNGHGDELTNDEMIAAIRDLILPQTTIIIPNS